VFSEALLQSWSTLRYVLLCNAPNWIPLLNLM